MGEHPGLEAIPLTRCDEEGCEEVATVLRGPSAWCYGHASGELPPLEERPRQEATA
jgi:hypothetical protein